MRSRGTSIRTKVVALLLSLVALWMFAAWVTLRDGFNLLGVQVINSKVYAPTEPLLQELQLERRLTQAYLSNPEAAQRTALEAEQRKSAGLAADFADSVRDWQVDIAGSSALDTQLGLTIAQVNALDQTRAEVLDRKIDRVAAAEAYTTAIESIFQIYDVTGSLDDKQIAGEAAALIQLNRMKELISQEDALLSGLFGNGRMSGPEYARYVSLVAAERFLGDEVRTRLADADERRFRQLVSGEAFTRLRAVQDSIIREGRPSTQLPIGAEQWRGTVEPALTEVNDAVTAGGEGIVDRATGVAVMVVVRLVLATGLGLLAVIASVVISITTARNLLRQLDRLREAAWQLADERLPRVVERLGRGEEVDVATEAPPLEFGTDEIGQVGKAFNAVQETALRTAVEQADLRRNVREVFLSLARRTQALVHRQLTLLDAMERREHDAEELEDLFRVDHLATRMRRNAENLIVLSGSTPGRAWRRNVPMVDVVRGAVAEVEDYTRVNVLPLGPVSLAGRAVGDVIHLLAELIENGLSFSPPHTTVEVRGQLVSNGFALEIEDRGLGMSEEDLAAANHRIVDQSELNLANAARLGLYVVSRLTERHGVRVRLKESAYGGTTAVVLIPLELVTEADASPEDSGSFRAGSAIPMPSTPAPESGSPMSLAPVALAAPTTTAPDVAATSAAPTPTDTTTPTSDEEAEADTVLPTRQRTTPTTGTPDLPTRARRGPGQPALEAPTVPTGLPAVERARPETRDAEPVAAGDGGPVPARADAERTDAGLPVRVRQANIVPELRDDPAMSETDDEDVVRPPEQVRRMMSSYQTGTRRGRTDAARLLGGASGAPAATPSEPTDEDPQAT
ncbi:nitrate- and nitrite sensing domain-containing protein [Micromonospora sp. DH14]|uniref:nitrate- and nitrite sensing domain-containing protein n=1 Tax=Micromonospora sp. DH14 TaxID=3040120 RepID=UPI002442B066|nr:nitrate- and nitrite sensing domain-containing protein [Micromonospora sp. DH14]MDG9676259.1 nitrate- and nitrite sensing domain-containing protein [Micromonospora sp. DH14]